jgi:hypothetical protein
VRWLLNRLFLKVGLKVRLLTGVGDHVHVFVFIVFASPEGDSSLALPIISPRVMLRQ